jgi:predicted nucleic acid-binding protein
MSTQNLLLPDSCIWIEYLNKNEKVIEWIDKRIENCVFNPIVYAEVATGEKTDSKKYKLFKSIYENALGFAITPKTGEIAESIHRSLRVKGLGHNRVLPDYYIAACCIENGITLATINKRDFENIEGLRLENWLN